ncbi:hypothetical protein [Zhihengliuella halotolerans]|uniref:Uncharacterized protein n=1 Tax=Zhihengliuella halotolerans TaxID=370736 RepID=A0A4Q8AC44_9MICC|nr:hypothetical protein [Zhihengliuella halotolerans]RZU61752.1 hypothetical protein EV380_1330 [Zhihengliuella halotolerans]
MHDRPAIRQLHLAGGSIRGIARDRAASRNAVRRALTAGAQETYWRPSAAEEAEPAVRDVLADYPNMTVSDIALMVDWRHSRRHLSDLVARLRPEFEHRTVLDARPLAGIRQGSLGACRTVRAGPLSAPKLTNVREASHGG